MFEKAWIEKLWKVNMSSGRKRQSLALLFDRFLVRFSAMIIHLFIYFLIINFWFCFVFDSALHRLHCRIQDLVMMTRGRLAQSEVLPDRWAPPRPSHSRASTTSAKQVGTTTPFTLKWRKPPTINVGGGCSVIFFLLPSFILSLAPFCGWTYTPPTTAFPLLCRMDGKISSSHILMTTIIFSCVTRCLAIR